MLKSLLLVYITAIIIIGFIDLFSLIFALMLGGRIGEFSFLWFSYKNVDGKYEWEKQKFYLFPTLSVCGEILEDRRKKFLWNTLVRLCTLVLTIPMAVFLKYQSVNNEDLNCLWIVPACEAFFYFIYLTKGLYSYYGNSTLSVCEKENAEYVTQMKNGVRPRENTVPLNEQVELNIFSSDILRNYVVYQYYKALDSRERAGLTRAIHCMEQSFMALVIGKQDSLQCMECIFYYSFVEPDRRKAEYYYKKKPLGNNDNMDVNDRRVYAYYLYYIQNDSALALQMIDKGLDVADNFQDKGNIEMEKDLLIFLKNTIMSRGEIINS